MLGNISQLKEHKNIEAQAKNDVFNLSYPAIDFTADGENFVIITVSPACWSHAFVLKQAKAPESPGSLHISHEFR